MKPEQYIRIVIQRHRVKQKSRAVAMSTLKVLRPCIGKWAGKYLRTIQPTGSYAKLTNITGATDIDFFISLRYDVSETLREVYKSLFVRLTSEGFSVREQNVSLRVNYQSLMIDLVPGVKQKGATNNHSIYRRKADTWTQTNIQRHILLVKKSGRLNEIRAIKIWRKLHGLDFPSFYLELTVIRALKNYGLNKLSSNIIRVFDFLSDEFEQARIIDPSNTNNIISDDLSEVEKGYIANIASETKYKQSWDEIIW